MSILKFLIINVKYESQSLYHSLLTRLIYQTISQEDDLDPFM